MVSPGPSVELLEELVEEYDAEVKFEIASACAWSGTLRLTLTDPPNRSSRSVTFYTGGGLSPEGIAARLLTDAHAWLRESGVKPMPPPDWMRR